jgi:hypothetical protein
MTPRRAPWLGLAVAGLCLTTPSYAQDRPVPSTKGESRKGPPKPLPKGPAPKPAPVPQPLPLPPPPPPTEGEKAGEGEPRISIEPSEPDEGAAPSVGCPAELTDAVCAALSQSEDERVGALLASLKGASLRQRIIAYEAYVRAHPRSRHAAVLYEEAAELRKWLARRIEGEPPRSGGAAARSFAPPSAAQAAAPLDVAIEIEGEVAEVHIQSRQDDGNYLAAPMRRIGSGHFGYTFAAEAMRAPGVVFFVEVVLPDGTTRAVAGDASRPFTIAVREPISLAGPGVEVAVAGEYLDYDRLRGRDFTWRSTGDFGLRFSVEGLSAINGGFTVVRGEAIEEEPTAIALTAGHLELEAGFHPHVAFLLRGIGGAVETGPLVRHATGGARVMARFGPHDGTHGILGVEHVAGWGTLGISALELALIDGFPLGMRFEVGDQPLGAVTYRGSIEIGHEIAEVLVLSARLSYQGRDGGDGGPGFGAGARARW